MLLSLLTVCLLLTLSVDTRVSGTCPPCPAPPVTACCKAGDQVLGTCCQVSYQGCIYEEAQFRQFNYMAAALKQFHAMNLGVSQ